jgi:hypothetical protein
MKVLIKENNSDFLKEKNKYDELCSYLQNVVDSYNLLNYTPLSIEELQALFGDYESTMFDKMTKGETILLMGHEVHKHEAMKIIKKPAGYDELYAVVCKFKEDLQNPQMAIAHLRFSLNSILKWFVLVDGKVQINEHELANLEERFKHYAVSDKAIAMHSFANAVIDAYYQFGINKVTSNPNGLPGIIKSLINNDYWGSGDKSVTLNVKTIVACNGTDGGYL